MEKKHSSKSNPEDGISDNSANRPTGEVNGK
jgi:hypothetical protein